MIVRSANEWGRLHSVIVGRADSAHVPMQDISLRAINYAGNLRTIKSRPYPRRVIEEANEDLAHLCGVLATAGVTIHALRSRVRMRVTAPTVGVRMAITRSARGTACWSSATRSWKRQWHCARATPMPFRIVASCRRPYWMGRDGLGRRSRNCGMRDPTSTRIAIRKSLRNLERLNLIRFHTDESVSVDPVIVLAELNASTFVFYTGRARKASTVLAEQRENIQAHRPLMRRMVQMNGVSDNSIDTGMPRASRTARAAANCLAPGNGGFLMFFAPPDFHVRICRTLPDLKPMRFRFDRTGAQIVFYQPPDSA